MRILVTSSRNPFALDMIRKLGSVGHEVYASDTYDGAMGTRSTPLVTPPLLPPRSTRTSSLRTFLTSWKRTTSS